MVFLDPPGCVYGVPVYGDAGYAGTRVWGARVWYTVAGTMLATVYHMDTRGRWVPWNGSPGYIGELWQIG